MKRNANETLVACVTEFLDICSFKMDISEHRMQTSVQEMNLPLQNFYTLLHSKIFLATCQKKYD